MSSFFNKLIWFFLIVPVAQLFANHNRSGEILYKRIPPYTSGTIPVYTYSITVIKYFDDGPGIADRCADTVYFGDGTKAIAPRVNGTNVCGCANCGELILNDPNYKVKKCVYSCTHTYSGAGSYCVSSTDPNRSQGVYNIPNSDQVPFSIQSLIVINSTGINSSPVLTNPPFYLGQVQNCFYFNPCAFDADADSLSYEIVPCNGGPNSPATGYFDPPSGAGGSFSINTLGLLNWCKPQLSAKYNIAIRINEWRKTGCTGNYQLNGYVTRDMEIVIMSSPTVTFNISNVFSGCVVAGGSYNLNILTTITAALGLTIALYGDCQYAENTPLAILTNTSSSYILNSGFGWPTNCTNVRKEPHRINLVCKTPYQSIYVPFNLHVIPPSPVIYNVISDTGQVTLFWHNVPGCLTKIKGYNVYRKTGPNYWSPSTCILGAPPVSGFQYLGFINATDSSYTDVNFDTIPNGRSVNYFLTTLTNECDEGYRSNVKTLPAIVGIRENNLKSGLKIYPNPFTNQLELELPGDYSGNMDVLIYSVDGKLVYKSETINANDKLILQVNNFDKGIYLLQLKTNKGVLSRKIIRN